MGNPYFVLAGQGAVADSLIAKDGTAYTKAAGTPIASTGGFDPSAPELVQLAGTDLTASSTGAATALTETLAAASGKTTYISGFEVTGLGATGASGITITVTGTITGTLNYVLPIPAGVTLGVAPLIVEFARPIPASAVNTAVVVNVPSFGSGNTLAAATAHGFQL